jgi:hypothetical protein
LAFNNSHTIDIRATLPNCWRPDNSSKLIYFSADTHGNNNSTTTAAPLALGQPSRIDYYFSANIHGNNNSTTTAALLALGQPSRIDY